ncbi:MAG: transporter substrate-binding domain-containing protein [Lachnospiraceae bacterium]|nr:transporter substrate-binding domain-containing protein [Lachnospiraceae bacterium]
MKKKLALLLVAAMSISMLSACGGATQQQAAPAEEEAAEEAPAEEEATEEAAAEEADAMGTAGDVADDGDIAYIIEKGKLIVGITDFAPMDYQENGEWVGFDADLARKVAEDLQVEIEFIEIDWDNKILELENKSIDVVWNGMTLTDEVKNAMETTNPYLNNAQVVVVKKEGADAYTDVASLADLSFAVEAGSAGEAAAKENSLNYTAVQTQADSLMEVNAGTSDACIIDLLMAGAMIGDGTSYADLTHTVELTTEEYGIGCRKGSDLAGYINEALKRYEADGSLEEIATTYGVQEALVARN